MVTFFLVHDSGATLTTLKEKCLQVGQYGYQKRIEKSGEFK